MNKNIGKKFLFGVVAILVCIALTGCTPIGSTTLGGGSSGSTGSSSQGALTSAAGNTGQSWPVQADLTKTVQIDFTHKSDKNKNTSLTYVLIQSEVPISLGKVSEGVRCNTDDALKPYRADCLGEEFDATTKSPDYMPPVKILRKNFREINIVSTPKSEPADVVFLAKTNPQTKGNGVVFFDVYLQQNSLSLLDTKSDRNYKTQLSLTDVLGDCGQLQPVDDPNLVAEAVQLGGSVEDIKKASEQRRKNMPPDTLDPITQDKLQEIIGLNPSIKKDDIEKMFDFTNENNPLTASFRKIGNNLEQNHISNNQQLNLKPDVFNIKSPDFLSNVQAMSLIIMKVGAGDAEGSPVLQIEKDGQKYLYAPQIASKITKVLPVADGKNTNLGISAVEFESKPVVSDPWCGFTPESKPAIYLYPTKPTLVKVKLNPPVGWISISDPKYKSSGWSVLAMPSGNIYSGLKKYPYLFYEAMLPIPEMPQNYVVLDGKNLSNELNDLGKKLSLNDKESREMAEFWSKKLPAAKYYQVGLMERSEIDKIEPVDINPTPDSVYRIRLVFKPMSEKLESSYNPTTHFERSGFSMVEWGGFQVK